MYFFSQHTQKYLEMCNFISLNCVFEENIYCRISSVVNDEVSSKRPVIANTRPRNFIILRIAVATSKVSKIFCLDSDAAKLASEKKTNNKKKTTTFIGLPDKTKWYGGASSSIGLNIKTNENRYILHIDTWFGFLYRIIVEAKNRQTQLICVKYFFRRATSF